MARKAASRDGATGITSSAVSPINKLPIHKRNYVKVRAEGGTVRAASAAAGVSSRQGSKYETEADIQAAYRSLMRQAIPAERLVGLIKGGCEATMPEYDRTGRKKRVADWKTRRGYIEMATRQSGLVEEKDGGPGVAINLTVNHIGQPNQGPSVTRHTIEANPN